MTTRKTLIDYAKNKPKGSENKNGTIQKFDEYSLRAEQTWFNGKGNLPGDLDIGVPVEIDYTTNERGFHNINSYRVMKSTEELDPMTDLGKNSRVTVKGRDKAIRTLALLKVSGNIISGATPQGGEFDSLMEHAWKGMLWFEKEGEKEGRW